MAQHSKGLEKVFSEGNWKEEAQGIISDVKDHVKQIELSKINTLGNNICINVTTAEDDNFCIELGSFGLRIVGYEFNDNSSPSNKYYETPYSLLSEISPKYRQLFGNSLIEKLLELKENKS